MSKMLHISGSIKVTAILSLILLTGCSNAKEYTTDIAKTGNIAEEIEVTGNVQGEQSTTYYAAVTSPISECDLEAGDIVTENELLLTYDTADLERVYEQAVVTAQSTENSMNGQITASNKNASLYSKAVNDSNIYMNLYAIARASYDQINQSQYQENWDIANIAKAIEGQIAEKNKTIADKTALANKKTEALLSLTPGSDEYKKVTDELNGLKQDITNLNKDVACLSGNLAALGPQMLSPEENAKATVNNNWMQDIQRNWSESTTLKNTYEGQILNSYQKDQLKDSYELAAMSVDTAEEEIEKAKSGVSAEYNGIVTNCFVSKGSVVSKGMPLFTIESSDDLKVNVGISKYDIGKIELGQRANVSIGGHNYSAKVSEINRLAQATDSSKTKVLVSVHIDDPDEYVYLGIEADVTIYSHEKENALMIPQESYYADDAGDYCYIIKNGVVEKRYITTGVSSNENIEVIDGLSAGETVITDSITDDSIGGRAVSK